MDSTDVYMVMLYCAYHGAGYHDYTFTEYPEIEAALLTKLDVNGDGSIDTIDVYFILRYVAYQGAGIPTDWDELYEKHILQYCPEYSLDDFKLYPQSFYITTQKKCIIK